MRGLIKQAKVCTMHKLTRSLSILRKKNSDEKVKSKEEKIVKKIFCLKELDADDVTKFLFTNTLSLESLLSNVKVTLKVQLMAAIGKHKTVAPKLDDFKSRHPDWSKSVHTILEKKKKKRLNHLKEGSTKEASGEVSEINESENIEGKESYVKIDKEENTEEDEVSLKSSSETENEVILKKGNGNHKTMKNKLLTKKTASDEESGKEEIEDEGPEDEGSEDGGSEDESDDELTESDSEEENTHKKTIYENDTITSVPEQISIVHKSEKADNVSGQCTKKVRDKNAAKLLKNEISSSKNNTSNIINDRLDISESLKHQPKPKSVAKVKVVDSFFMTKDNKEYLSSQPPTLSLDNGGKQLDEMQISTSGKFDSFRGKEKPSHFGQKRKWSGHEDDWSEKKHNQHNLENNVTNSLTKPRLIIGNRKERRKTVHETINYEKVEKLHPSWEAKKKQSSITQFQGKKIVFD